MATTTAQLLLQIKSDMSGVRGDLRDLQRDMQGTHKVAMGMGDAIKAGFGAFVGLGIAQAGFSALKESIFGSVQAAAEAQMVHAQLDAVLKSTGGAAGVTAEAANELADSLSKVTMFDDEAILGAENLLLTFTRIGNDVFPEATEAVLNMSQALGQDLKSSAIQLGKALNDPIGGVTALRRVGVQLTDAQEELIKKMVEAGDVAGAQKIILSELTTEFGGAAKAAGETLPGKLAILKTQLGNVQEEIGGVFIPVLADMADWFAKWIPGAMEQLRRAFTQLQAIVLYILKSIADTVASWADFLQQTIGNVFDDVFSKIRVYQSYLAGVLAFIPKVVKESSLALQALDAFAHVQVPGGSPFGKMADEARRWSGALQEALVAQIDIANGVKALDKAGKGVLPRIPQDPVTGGAASAAKEAAKEREKIILDMPGLLSKAFDGSPFERFKEQILSGVDVLGAGTKEQIDDWGRQFSEFTRDTAILLQRVRDNGIAASKDTLEHLDKIFDGWGKLPTTLQAGLSEVKAQFNDIMQSASDAVKQFADAQMSFWDQQREAAYAHIAQEQTLLAIREKQAQQIQDELNRFANARVRERIASEALARSRGRPSASGLTNEAVARELGVTVPKTTTVTLEMDSRAVGSVVLNGGVIQQASSAYRMGYGDQD